MIWARTASCDANFTAAAATGVAMRIAGAAAGAALLTAATAAAAVTVAAALVVRATAAAADVVVGAPGAAKEAATRAEPGAPALDTEGTIWLVRPATAPRTATVEMARKVEAFVNCMSLCLLTRL